MIQATSPAPHKFDKIFAIVNAAEEKNLIAKVHSSDVLGCDVIPATGTVSNEMFHYLGLEDKKRCLVQMISRKENTRAIISALFEHFQMSKVGKGIIFAVPITRSTGLTAMFHLRDEHRVKDGAEPFTIPDLSTTNVAEEEPMNNQYELLYVIAKSGFAGEAMDAAKAAGAHGGTIIHGRGISMRENVRLFGVAIEPERDVLLILVDCENVEDVMKSIADNVGLSQPAQSISFAVPVSHVMGLTPHTDDGAEPAPPAAASNKEKKAQEKALKKEEKMKNKNKK